MEANSIEVDPAYDIDQQMIQDCEVCCQPIELLITEHDQQIYVDAKQEWE
jgi:hypothetical protein